MLELKNVYFSYKAQSHDIHDVSLRVNPGEFLAIVGRNGSGKTTLTRLMMTLKKPTKGELFFQGNSLASATPAKMAHHIGYVFQNPDRQIFHDTVAEEVAYGPKQIGCTPEQIQTFVTQALEVTGLSHLAATYPLSLSKGQKQRLTIASALAMQPKILILDEPTSGQDAREREQLLQLLLKLHQQGTTILLVTHDMEFLSCCAQRAIVMKKGQKVFDGTVAELFHDTNQLTDWGLIEPAALKISRQLVSFQISQTTSITQLGNQIANLLRRNDDHAENSPHY
ncbi:energy-coupling factor ABC transporter ATP-binding protein [Pelosinus baikalensis]|uniref:Energy-coupling factor ABC transporter ATP-binding protein n=1 Tax=Pelosinus baikalensis TaxID=2892015 RepID=A0ABS8HTE2_9FIRM|nr:ABC transporter ATP-binding protein [Pelosinus baikalensis]MCC5465881.1 energy-coupling factor ABC transporter ATP-binding protein [Pelosinus baikalensis]